MPDIAVSALHRFTSSVFAELYLLLSHCKREETEAQSILTLISFDVNSTALVCEALYWGLVWGPVLSKASALPSGPTSKAHCVTRRTGSGEIPEQEIGDGKNRASWGILER